MQTQVGRKVKEIDRERLLDCVSILGEKALPNDQMGIFDPV